PAFHTWRLPRRIAPDLGSRPWENRADGVERQADRKQAERTGFEPVVEFYPYTGLANRRYRPLSHLSGSTRSVRVLKALELWQPFPACARHFFSSERWLVRLLTGVG